MRCRSGALRDGITASNKPVFLPPLPEPFRPVYGRCPAEADQRPCQPSGALPHSVGEQGLKLWTISCGNVHRIAPVVFPHVKTESALIVTADVWENEEQVSTMGPLRVPFWSILVVGFRFPQAPRQAVADSIQSLPCGDRKAPSFRSSGLSSRTRCAGLRLEDAAQVPHRPGIARSVRKPVAKNTPVFSQRPEGRNPAYGG
jgi:hypothetical protein